MRESILRDYFLGLFDESRLSKDLASSAVKTSDVITCYVTEDLTEDFEVNPVYLIRLCDAVLADKFDLEHLELIGFALETSEHFIWDDENAEGEDSPVADTIHAWASPEINYPLNVENIAKFRELLITGKDTFTRNDVPKQAKKRKD